MNRGNRRAPYRLKVRREARAVFDAAVVPLLPPRGVLVITGDARTPFPLLSARDRGLRRSSSPVAPTQHDLDATSVRRRRRRPLVPSGVNWHGGSRRPVVNRLECRGEHRAALGLRDDGVGDAVDDGAHALLDGETSLGLEGVQAMTEAVELLVHQLVRVTAHGLRVGTHASATFSRRGSGGATGIGWGRRPTRVKPANISVIPTSWPRYTSE
jgi:hypothetical protein